MAANISINIEGMGFWSLVEIINCLSEAPSNDGAMEDINDYVVANSAAFLRDARNGGDEEATELIVALLADRFEIWLDENDRPEVWAIVEQAAASYSASGMSGLCEGLCEALARLSGGLDARRFVAAYAADWYVDGCRVEG